MYRYTLLLNEKKKLTFQISILTQLSRLICVPIEFNSFELQYTNMLLRTINEDKDIKKLIGIETILPDTLYNTKSIRDQISVLWSKHQDICSQLIQFKVSN